MRDGRLWNQVKRRIKNELEGSPLKLPVNSSRRRSAYEGASLKRVQGSGAARNAHQINITRGGTDLHMNPKALRIKRRGLFTRDRRPLRPVLEQRRQFRTFGLSLRGVTGKQGGQDSANGVTNSQLRIANRITGRV